METIPTTGPYPPRGKPFLCSWSGGKDSCLALHRAAETGAVPARLLTVLNENGVRSRSHGLTQNVLEEQAACMEIPLTVCSATWETYEEVFIDALREVREQGADACVFGDIDLPAHLEWEQKVCREAGLEAYLPLWEGNRKELMQEFISLGFKAIVVTVRETKLGPEYLGRVIDERLVDEFESIGIDPCGEKGEYHTVVTDGPLFRRPLALKKGETVKRKDCFSLDVSIRS